MQQIMEFFSKLPDSSDWPPRWHCGRWTDFHGWLYIVSDLLIWSAYFTIPLVILKYISKRQDLKFIKLYFLFAAFILACGSTHFLDAAAFWVPLYRISALVRLITGILSWTTVFYLIRFLPVAFSLKSQQQLENEIMQRTEELRRLNDDLEERVRSRTHQLEIANKEMEAFTYSVSHDLRAPLRAISGFSTMLEQRLTADTTSGIRYFTEAVISNTQKMSRLIDDLLIFSKTGRHQLLLMPIDTSTMVDEIIEELTPPEGKATWHRKTLPDVYADLATIRQVWVNLLSNAIKYSSKNSAPRIEIDSYETPGAIVFSIKDNGVGFDNKYAHKLFNVFQRLHGEDQFEGTGVGLAIVTKIISKHGGQVWAEGKVNEGASFYFSLPRKIQPG